MESDDERRWHRQLHGVGAGWSPLAVRAKGFAPAAMMLGTSGNPDTVERVALSLARGAALPGRVVDEKGKPVADARVVATNASEPLPVVDPRRDGVLAARRRHVLDPALSAGTWRVTATAGDVRADDQRRRSPSTASTRGTASSSCSPRAASSAAP